MDLFPQGKGGPSVFERPRLGVYRPVGERHYPSSCARTHISRNTHCLPALPRLHLQGYLVLLFLSLYLFTFMTQENDLPFHFFFLVKSKK